MNSILRKICYLSIIYVSVCLSVLSVYVYFYLFLSLYLYLKISLSRSLSKSLSLKLSLSIYLLIFLPIHIYASTYLVLISSVYHSLLWIYGAICPSILLLIRSDLGRTLKICAQYEVKPGKGCDLSIDVGGALVTFCLFNTNWNHPGKEKLD